MLHGPPNATATCYRFVRVSPLAHVHSCVRDRLSAFQVGQGFCAPAGRCSSAQMLRCTLASRGSSVSLHDSTRAAFAVVLIDSVHLMKLLRDFRRATTPRCPLSGCLWCVICHVRSVRLATALLTSVGAIPASTGSQLVFVGVRQPVIIRQVSFSMAFSFFAPGKHAHQLSSIAPERTMSLAVVRY